MVEFEYVAVLVSIIIGFGLTHLLSGLADMLNRRGEYTLDPVHALWAVLVFFILCLNWWVFFQYRQIAHWTFGMFMAVAVWSVIGYLLAVVLFPRRLSAGEDYGEVFERNRILFLGLVIAYVFSDILLTALRGGLFEPPEYLPFTLHLAVLSALGMVVRRRWFQLALVIYILVIGFVWSFLMRDLLTG